MKYDLDAPGVPFWFRLNLGGRHIDLVCDMKPYEDFVMQELLSQTEVLLRENKDDSDVSDIVPAGLDKIPAFFDAHLIRVTHNGAELTREQIEKLDARCDLKAAVIRQGYNGLLPVEGESVEIHSDEDGDVLASIDDLISSEACAKTLFPMWDGAKEVRVPINHYFCDINARHRMDWKRRQKVQRIDNRTIRQPINHRLVEALYGAMIQRTEGFRCGDVPCETLPITQYVKKIPYLMKWFALTRIFEGSVKNA